MKFKNAKEIDGALQRLGKRLLYEYADPIALIVCGGSALNVLNLGSRTTGDVDVLAIVKKTAKGVRLCHDRSLPKDFSLVVAEVGRDLGLDADWLNMGPKDVLEVYGPPKGMMRRCERREYGPALTVYFISRLDQIHFKILAVADPKAAERHLEDLKRWIKPDAAEVLKVVKWLLDRRTSSWFRRNIRRVVEELGYEKICGKIPE